MDISKSARALRLPVKKIVLIAALTILGAMTIFLIWLYRWDGGFPEGNRRILLPGVQVNLQTVETARGPVEFDLFGTKGPVVLSVHPGLGGADQGRLFAGWLQEDGYRILSPSRPGYLGTPLSSGKTLEEQADLIAALLDKLKIPKVGIVSASAGGPAAYTFAAKYPDKVWGLVSISGVSRRELDKSSASALQTVFMNSLGQKLVKLTADLSLETMVAGTLDETSYFTGEQKEQRTAYIMSTPDKRAFFEAMLNTTFPYDERTAGTDNDAAQARTAPSIPFERIQAPCLIIHGTQDADVPFYNGVYAYEHIPGARCYWMEHDDHLGFWLSPESGKAQDAARDFLRQHSPVE